MRKGYKRELVFLALIILSSVMILSYQTLRRDKVQYVEDEYYTYALANCREGIYGAFENGVKQDPRELFEYYFYADTSRVGIQDVWENQSKDVHPPLYYLLQHLFNLLTHNFGGLKSGVILNIIFHICNIVLVYLILRKMLGRGSFAVLGCCLYAHLPLVLENVTLIRMYALVCTFVLLLILLLVTGMRAGKRSGRFYVYLGLISAGGALTHYYFLVYLFFSCLVWGCYLLVTKKWKETAVFVGTMCAAGGVSIAVFPSMVFHIFSGYRGTQSFENLNFHFSEWREAFAYYVGVMDSLSGGLLIGICVAAVICFVGGCRRVRVKEIFQKEWFLLLIPAVFYFFLIMKIAVMDSERYISLIYGVSVILLVYGLKACTDTLQNEKLQYMALILTLGVILNNCWREELWQEKDSAREFVVTVSEKYGKGNECIHIYESGWKSLPCFSQFVDYESIIFIPESETKLLDAPEYLGYDRVAVSFSSGIPEERQTRILNQMIENSAQLERYAKLYQYQYHIVYFLE